jgi:hypothetical protein
MMAPPPSRIRFCKGKEPLNPRRLRAAGIVWFSREILRPGKIPIPEIDKVPVRKDQPAGTA